MEQAFENSGISIAPLERPRASNTYHMLSSPSILGAHTHYAECITKEAKNAPSSEKSSSTESSSDEIEDETNSKASAKSSDINSSSANNGNTKNVSDIEDHSIGNKASDTNKITDNDKITDDSKIIDAEDTKANKALDNKQSQTVLDFLWIPKML